MKESCTLAEINAEENGISNYRVYSGDSCDVINSIIRKTTKELFLEKYKYLIIRITSYNVCYTKLLREKVCTKSSPAVQCQCAYQYPPEPFARIPKHQ